MQNRSIFTTSKPLSPTHPHILGVVSLVSSVGANVASRTTLERRANNTDDLRAYRSDKFHALEVNSNRLEEEQEEEEEEEEEKEEKRGRGGGGGRALPLRTAVACATSETTPSPDKTTASAESAPIPPTSSTSSSPRNVLSLLIDLQQIAETKA